jgi:hypothetical protein
MINGSLESKNRTTVAKGAVFPQLQEKISGSEYHKVAQVKMAETMTGKERQCLFQ